MLGKGLLLFFDSEKWQEHLLSGSSTVIKMPDRWKSSGYEQIWFVTLFSKYIMLNLIGYKPLEVVRFYLASLDGVSILNEV